MNNTGYAIHQTIDNARIDGARFDDESRYTGYKIGPWIPASDEPAADVVKRKHRWIRLISVIMMITGILSLASPLISTIISAVSTHGTDITTSFDSSLIVSGLVTIGLGVLFLMKSNNTDVENSIVFDREQLSEAMGTGALRWNHPDHDSDGYRHNYIIDDFITKQSDDYRWYILYANNTGSRANSITLKNYLFRGTTATLKSMAWNAVDRELGDITLVILEVHGHEARLLVPFDVSIILNLMKQLGIYEKDSNISYDSTGIAYLGDNAYVQFR